MKTLKRILPLLLLAALTLTACGSKQGQQQENNATPEERAAAYAAAITAARDDEMNEYFPIMTNADETEAADKELTFTMLGFAPEDAEAYAVSMSLMNVNAYAIVAVKPAEGKEETVKTGLENYVETQKASFEQYLEDQHEIASSAKLETLDDGSVLLVMCEGQDEIFDSIKSALTKGE